MPPIVDQNCGPCCNDNTPCLTALPGPPGEQGPPGMAGTNGTDGIPAYTITTAQFEQPLANEDVVVFVNEGLWATGGQVIFVQNAGYFLVVSSSENTLLLRNLNYSGNALPGDIIASAQGVSPAGPQGATGTLTGAAGGDLTGNYPNPSLINSGVTPGTYSKITVDIKGRATTGASLTASDIPSLDSSKITTGIFPIAQGGTNAANAVNAFNNLSPVTTQGDIIYRDATSNVRLPLGTPFQVLKSSPSQPLWAYTRYDLLGFASCDCNVTTDTAISIYSSKYIIRQIVAFDASTSLTTTVGGIYTAASKGGDQVVANSQVYTALVAPSNFLDLTLNSSALTNYQTTSNLYFSPTTPQGAAATVSIFVYGDVLNP